MKAEDILQEVKGKNILALLVIPAGFENGVSELKPQTLVVYNIIRNFSLMGSSGSKSVKGATTIINEYISSQYIMKSVRASNPEDIKSPIKLKDIIVVGEKATEANPDQITTFIVSQTTFLPIVLFMVIIFASQMIAVTIASEKENKTLETLLSTPVSRTTLVTAKMVAAGLVSLIMAAAYMLGFNYYMTGITGGALKEASNPALSEAVRQLGLTLAAPGYALLGISLFLSILIALAISLIAGSFAEDVKKVQGLIAPIMFLVMIPYLMSMFVDVNNTTPFLKYFLYAIPFSHTFLASNSLFVKNYSLVIYGILYQILIFAVLSYIAGRIFSSDKILTMKLSFNRKKGLRP
jgi:ABC-2 type transport system permease protein